MNKKLKEIIILLNKKDKENLLSYIKDHHDWYANSVKSYVIKGAKTVYVEYNCIECDGPHCYSYSSFCSLNIKKFEEIIKGNEE